MTDHDALDEVRPDIIVGGLGSEEPLQTHAVCLAAISNRSAELVTDVEDDVYVPPGMELRYCPVEKSFWHVAKGDPYCPACGTRRGDIH